MRVGLTYDLRSEYLAAGYGEEETAEFDRDDTIEAIEGALQDLGYDTERIGHLRSLVGRLAAGERWDLVFNFAEGLSGGAREAQVPALLEGYGIPCVFSDALILALTLDKALTKRVVRDLGLPTPDFHVVETVDDIGRVNLPYPLFAKPVAEGTAKGVDGRSLLGTPAELDRVCRRLLASYRQPVLVETYLPGREFTVGLVGTGEEARALGTLEVTLLNDAEPHSYTYVNKERCEELIRYTLAPANVSRQAEAIALAAWRGLRCRDAGRVDLRQDAAGEMHFLEVNPLSGLHPEHSDLPILCTALGIPYRELMRMIMDSAVARVGQIPVLTANL
jgi:D-alanine-D-alanine ligase